MNDATIGPRRGNGEALARARAANTARKRADVLRSLSRAADRRRPLSVSALAAEAGVSRQFLYSHDDLLRALRAHQSNVPAAPTEELRGARTSDLINAQGVISRLRSEITVLNGRLEAGLAAQLELRDERRLRVSYEQRGLEIERLVTANADLTRTVHELRELVRTLEDELVVERSALRDLANASTNITALPSHRGR